MEAVTDNSKDCTFQSTNVEDSISTKDKKKDSGGIWKCFCCSLEERYNFKGTKPPFAKHLYFSEDCYIMKDPFSPPNRGEILVLGADCSICGNPVCMECSLFYAKRFCKVCALKNIEHFPLKLQSKIMHLNRENNEDV